MKRTLELGIDSVLLEKAEKKAAQTGLNCVEYVRGLIEQDVQSAVTKAHRFSSEDLVGTFDLSGESATNQRVRDNLHRCSEIRHAGDR